LGLDLLLFWENYYAGRILLNTLSSAELYVDKMQ
jgi:hypothetical protein